MHPYTRSNNKGRHIGGHDIHHRTADQPRGMAKTSAKAARRGARQEGRKQACEPLECLGYDY